MMSGLGKIGACKALKWQALHGSLAKRVVIRGFAFAVAISMLPLMQQLICDAGDGASRVYSIGSRYCGSDLGFMDPISILGRVLKPFVPFGFINDDEMCREIGNLTMAVVSELMGMGLLSRDARALCLGLGSPLAVDALRGSGFGNVLGSEFGNDAHRHSIFRLLQKDVLVYGLDYEDNTFDFVYVRDLDKVSVPALLVDEVERVLKPDGLGAVIVAGEGSNPGSLVRLATPVSSFLKTSYVIHVSGLMGFTLVAFKKKLDMLNSFKQYHLPSSCPSIARNKPLIERMEALVDEKRVELDEEIKYLPTFINITSDQRLVYVDMAAKQAALNFSNNNWFLPSYPIDSRSFDVNIVDHDVLVLSSHVNRPGVTFIYHPELASDKDKPMLATVQDEEIPIDDVDFDFLVWFKDTVEFADLVVLKMNVGKAELRFLFELFESGTICSVDELFLQCSDSDLESAGADPMKGCMDLFKGLRRTGVFVHQWWSN